MKRNQKDNLPYLAPWCEVVEAENSQLICSTVTPSNGSQEDDYEDKGDQEGDDFDVDLDF